MGSNLFIISKTENWRTIKIAQKLNLFRNLFFDFIVKNKDTTENIGISVELTAKIIFPIVISPILINGCGAINLRNTVYQIVKLARYRRFAQPRPMGEEK